MFKQVIGQRKQKSEPEPPKKKTTPKAKNKELQPGKRGRPAIGKRSDPDWVGRTYYIRKETDLDVQSELLKLKRQSIELDKSELVDFLLGEWVKFQNNKKADFRIGENPK
ncbi:hypothetical protein [Picosynechococcus sp. PCC 7117]|uniref:hypothetical protein n=1 Tax=Picosynechococcus sp. PCC 7117 TaxID=195498 RepID=UPI000810A087|nr:hypothetical protein [Picosynechococcus sp. PCC 7117]ANV88868.1 hypothetical protein AWQ22_14760 [Picosynechococcus sp. PCC 7117]